MKTSLLSWSMVLVATALVACGDDGETTSSGTGGAGGQAATTGATTSTGSPTSTTTSTGTPTSTASTSSGEGGDPTGGGGDPTGGGGDPTGGGGDPTGGGGAPEGCEVIEIGDLEPVVQYAAVADFTYGAADPDVFQVGVLVNNLEGETELGTGANESVNTCEQCVLAFVDGVEDIFGTIYSNILFATEGTLTLPDGFSGEASVANVVLREFDQETGEILEDGLCFYVAGGTWDYDNTIPSEWQGNSTEYGCSPGFYSAEDGCDCLCGAPDPDCELPKQEVYNCADGQTCSEDGSECEGVPTGWTCTEDEYEDGATCDCACGAHDPDCDDPGNPVDGCADGQLCSASDTCVDPEAICDDLLDNDEDGIFDCDDETSCQDEAECEPGDGAVGVECDANTDCDATDNDPICLSEAEFDFEGGACSEWCDLATDDCPAGSICLGLGLPDRGVCAPTCGDDDDCRDGAHCVGEAPDTFCLPDPAACFDAALPLVLTATGTTVDGVGAPSGSCANGGGAVLYTFTTVAAGEYTFTLASATDQVLSIREECALDSTELACEDATVGGTDEVMTVELEAATTYTLIVQAYSTAGEGPYTVSVE